MKCSISIAFPFCGKAQCAWPNMAESSKKLDYGTVPKLRGLGWSLDGMAFDRLWHGYEHLRMNAVDLHNSYYLSRVFCDLIVVFNHSSYLDCTLNALQNYSTSTQFGRRLVLCKF